MTVELKGNAEYAAQVIKVKNITTFEALDNLVGIAVNGMTALVQKNVSVGDQLLVFPTGSQLAEEFARDHELMRDQGGYLENQRRVKAIRLRGVPSNMLAIRNPYPDVTVGTLFDTVDDKAICWKYEVPVKQSNPARAQAKVWKRVDDKMLPEHLDTSNWYRNADMVPMDSVFTLTQKLHGTSIRISNTVVKRKLNWLERLAVKVGIPVAETEYDFVVGSRRVIKDVNSGSFYGEDIYTREGLKYKDAIPKGFVVYGELVGWASNDKPIQKNYTYGLPQGQCELYVYRVATITPDGILTDLTWPAVKAFCRERGLKHVPEMFTTGEKYLAQEEADLIRDSVDLKFLDEHEENPWVDRPVPLDAKSPCDEGLVVRVDNDRSTSPEMFKCKSSQFLEHESALLDQNEEILS